MKLKSGRRRSARSVSSLLSHLAEIAVIAEHHDRLVKVRRLGEDGLKSTVRIALLERRKTSLLGPFEDLLGAVQRGIGPHCLKGRSGMRDEILGDDASGLHGLGHYRKQPRVAALGKLGDVEQRADANHLAG